MSRSSEGQCHNVCEKVLT